MQYEEPSTENRAFVEEVQRMKHFNNLHCHLPGDFYRWSYEQSKARGANPPAHAKCIPIWQAIDEFIEREELDYKQIIKDFHDGAVISKLREKSQIDLCPLYIFLRKRGFTSEELCT
jgi:hypothetical protein